MPYPVPGSRVNGETVAGEWTKVFETRTAQASGASVRCKSDASGPIAVCAVQVDESAPSDDDAIDDHEMWLVFPGDTLPLDRYGDHRVHLYVRGANDDAQPFAAWENKGT